MFQSSFRSSHHLVSSFGTGSAQYWPYKLALGRFECCSTIDLEPSTRSLHWQPGLWGLKQMPGTPIPERKCGSKCFTSAPTQGGSKSSDAFYWDFRNAKRSARILVTRSAGLRSSFSRHGQHKLEIFVIAKTLEKKNVCPKNMFSELQQLRRVAQEMRASNSSHSIVQHPVLHLCLGSFEHLTICQNMCC